MPSYVYGEPYKDLAYKITISRPEKLNAINDEMWDALAKELNRGCSTELKSILLTGTESAFSSGDDIDAMYRLYTPEEAKGFFEKIYNVFTAMSSCHKPIVCAVKGLAAGGGAELLLACDIVVAAENSWISFPEVALGLIPPFLLGVGTRALGYRRARYLAMSGRRLSASEAAVLGIVDEVVPQSDVDQTVDDILSTLASFPDEALESIKKFTQRDIDAKAVREVIDRLAELVLTRDAKERMELFKSRKLKPAAVRGERKAQ
jgi:enoyl-CoA hydratase/carnithine racemase